MARVPQYDGGVQVQNEPQVRERNVGSPEAFGAGIGRSVQQLGGVVNQIAQREQEKADIAALMGADRELADLELQLFHDPDNGAYAKRGRDAFGTPETVFPTWDKRVSEIEGRLTPAQRAAFQRQAQGRRQSLQTGLAKHITSESDRFYAQEADATVTTSAAAAAANYTDPDRIALEADRATRAAMSLDDGAAPEVVKVRIMEAQSSVYGAAITRRLQDDPAGAISYFESVKDKMSPGQLARMEPVIREAQRTRTAFDAADRALNGDGGTGDYENYLVALESGGNPNARAGTSSATGLHQFTKDTWLDTIGRARPDWAEGMSEAELLDMRTDPAKSAEMERVLRAQNSAALEKAGAPLTRENLYAAHHFGAAGGVAFAKASPDTPIEEILDPAQIRANGYLSGMTKAEVEANWARRAGQAGGDGRPRNLSQALGRLRDLDPEDRKLAEARVRQEWSAIEQARQDASDARLNDGFAHIQSGGTTADLPPALRANMTPKEIADLEQYERVRQKNGGQVETDLTRYAELLDMAATRPLDFASMSLVADQAKLSEADYKRLVGAQAEVKAGRASALVAERKLVNEVATPVLRELEILRPVKGAPTRSQAVAGQEKRAVAFTSAVQQEVTEFRERYGKDPTVDDVQGIVDRLVISQTIETPGTFWGTNEVEQLAFEADKPPADPRMRGKNRIYSTPRGPMRWTGTGWVEVEPAL